MTRLTILTIAFLAALAACQGARETNLPAEAPAGAATSALEGETLCHESAGRPPLAMKWSFDTQAVLETDAEALVQLELEAREDLNVVLRLVSEGLDARTVSRDYGSYALGAGDPVTVGVRLADLPLQSTTHSATGTVEATVTRADGSSVTMHSPPFQHHFTAGYENIVTYPYDEMINTFNGGQIGDSAFEVTGRVFIDGEWRAIDDQRAIELELPQPFVPPIEVLLPSPGLEPPFFLPIGRPICVNWQTRYFDAARGEDVANTPGTQLVDASHALVQIERVLDGDCPASYPGTCGPVVWKGPLDWFGCASVPDSEVGDQYFVWVYGQFEREIDGETATAEIHHHDDHGESFGVPVMRLFAEHGPEGFGPPLGTELVDHILPVWRSWENAAAVLSLLFVSPFVVPGRSTIVNANLGCQSTHPDIGPADACAHAGSLETGPWINPAAGGTAPGALQYKYVLAHEAGHTMMHQAAGAVKALYTFYGPIEDACLCNHIPDGTANRLHCLQSVEYASAAQAEGFGHFVAARLFNDPGGSDCRFSYYKHFREDDGTVRRPPYDVDCRNAVQWRDSHDGCMFWEAGTEYDWMQFYWNVNTVGSNTTTVEDLFAIYQLACGGRCSTYSSRVEVTWEMLRDAAQAHFGESDPRFIKFETTGNEFGVDEDF